MAKTRRSHDPIAAAAALDRSRSSSPPRSYTTAPLHEDRHALATLFSFIETKERILTIGRVCHLWLKYSVDPIAWAHDRYVLPLHPSKPYPGEIAPRYRPLIRSVRLCDGVGDIKKVGSVEVSRMMNLVPLTGLTELTLSDHGVPNDIMNEIAKLLKKLGMKLESHIGSVTQPLTTSHRSIQKLNLILSAHQDHHLAPLFTSHFFRHIQQLHIRHLHESQIESIGHLQQLRELMLQESHPKEVWDVIHQLPLLDTLTVRLCDPIPTRPLPPSLTSLTLPLLDSDLDGRTLFPSLETSPPPQLRCVKLSVYKLPDSPDGAVHPAVNSLTQLIRHFGSLVSLTSFQFTYFHFTQRPVLEPQLSTIHVGWLLREFLRLNRSHLYVPNVQIALPMFQTFSMVRRPGEMDHLPNNVAPMAQIQLDSVDQYLVANPSTRTSLLSLFTLAAPYLSSLVKLHLQQVKLNEDLLQILITLPTTSLQQLTIIAAVTQTDLFTQLEKCQQFWAMIGRQCDLHEVYFNPFRVLQVATNEHPWTREDDQLLISCIKAVGTNFTLIAQRMSHRSQLEIKSRLFITTTRIRVARRSAHVVAGPAAAVPPTPLLQQQAEPLDQFCGSIYDQIDLDGWKPAAHLEPHTLLDSGSIPSNTTSSSSSSSPTKFHSSGSGGGGLVDTLISCSALKKLEFYSYAPNTFFNETVCYALSQLPSLESLTLKLCSSELRLLVTVVDSSLTLKSLTLYTFPQSTEGNTSEANKVVLERDNVDKIEFLTLLLTYKHLTCIMNGSPIMDVLKHEEHFRQERMKKAVKQEQKCSIN